MATSLPHVFATQTGPIALSKLDDDFAALRDALDSNHTTVQGQLSQISSAIAAIQAQLGGGTSPSLPTVGTLTLSSLAPATGATVTITGPTISGGSPATVSNERYEIYIDNALQQTFARSDDSPTGDQFVALAGWAGLAGIVRYRADHPAGAIAKDSSTFTTQSAGGVIPASLSAPVFTTTEFDANSTATVSVGSWSNTPTSYEVLWTMEKSLTGSLSAGATSATLSSQWLGSPGTYTVKFSSGEEKSCTFTMFSTAVTWSGGLASSSSSAFEVHVGTSTGAAVTRSKTFSINSIGSKFRAYVRATNATGTSSYVVTSNSPYCADSIGAVPVEETPASFFNKFAAPSAQGNGSGSSYANAGLYTTMISGLQAGDRLALLGGTYTRDANSQYLTLNVAGTAQNPVLIESYPGETATFTWNSNTVYDYDNAIVLRGSYMRLRRVNITGNSYTAAFTLAGSNNLVEGCSSYANKGTGFQIGGYYTSTNNTLRACRSYNNNSTGTPYTWSGGDGALADGIILDSSAGNNTGSLIEYCNVYQNSDDGIDNWSSTGATIRKNRSYSNGAGPAGAGLGIKFTGPGMTGAICENNLVWGNGVNDQNGWAFSNNSGDWSRCNKNTAWGNKGGFGIGTSSGGELTRNISINNTQSPQMYWGTGVIANNNSTQRTGTPIFISTDPNHIHFLRPTPGGGFDDIGAYAGLATSSAPA